MKFNKSSNKDKKYNLKTFIKGIKEYVTIDMIHKKYQKVLNHINEKKVSICITLFLSSFVLLFLSIQFVGEDEKVSNTFTFWSALVCVMFLLIWLGNTFYDVANRAANHIFFVSLMLFVLTSINIKLPRVKATCASFLITYIIYLCVMGFRKIFISFRNFIKTYFQNEQGDISSIKIIAVNITAFIGVLSGLISAITLVMANIEKLLASLS